MPLHALSHSYIYAFICLISFNSPNNSMNCLLGTIISTLQINKPRLRDILQGQSALKSQSQDSKSSSLTPKPTLLTSLLCNQDT